MMNHLRQLVWEYITQLSQAISSSPFAPDRQVLPWQHACTDARFFEGAGQAVKSPKVKRLLWADMED